MAVNKSRRNKVYDYSYTAKYDTDWSLYADASYLTDQYINIIRPYVNTGKTLYDFKAYTTDYQAMVNLCNFIKSLPDAISCGFVQTYYGPYELDFTVEGVYANKVKDFMDNANRNAEIEHFYSYISNKGKIECDPDDISNCGKVTLTPYSITISDARRNGKEIEKDMQKFTPKKLIYSGGKTIVIWPDNSKTIVSCGDGDQYDEYAGFCAALAKKIFGSTSAAKRIMNKNKKVDISKDKENLEEVDYEALKKSIQNALSNAIKECLNMCSSMAFEEKFDDIHSEKEKDDEQSE